MLDSDIRRWVVCERGNRWSWAVSRFGPDMTPAPLVLDVVESDPTSVIDEIEVRLPSLVLWEIAPGSLADVAQCLMTIDAKCPRALQLVADAGLSIRERSLLCEFPVGVVLQHPEQLPRLRPLVEGHFASTLQLVD